MFDRRIDFFEIPFNKFRLSFLIKKEKALFHIYLKNNTALSYSLLFTKPESAEDNADNNTPKTNAHQNPSM